MTASATDWRCDHLTKELERLRTEQHEQRLAMIKLQSDLESAVRDVRYKHEGFKHNLMLAVWIVVVLAAVALSAWAGRGAPGS